MDTWGPFLEKLIHGKVPDTIKLIFVGGLIVFSAFFLRDMRRDDLNHFRVQIDSVAVIRAQDIRRIQTQIEAIRRSVAAIDVQVDDIDTRLNEHESTIIGQRNRLDVIVRQRRESNRRQPKNEQMEWYWNDDPPEWRQRPVP